MPSKQLIVLLTFMALTTCLALPQKITCERPEVFKNTESLSNYIKCLRLTTGPERYGKRSAPPSSIFFQKLHPKLANYDRDYLEELIYELMRQEHDLV